VRKKHKAKFLTIFCTLKHQFSEKKQKAKFLTIFCPSSASASRYIFTGFGDGIAVRSRLVVAKWQKISMMLWTHQPFTYPAFSRQHLTKNDVDG